MVRSFIYAAPGDPYSPKALTDIRKSVSRIEALGSVRVREAEALDASGRLPVAVDVTERPPRLVGFSARYSTLDGPGLRAYWANRNLFGGAERLRFDADLYYATRDDIFRFDPVTGKKRDDWDWSDIGGRFSASFLKPALYGTRWDLLVDGTVAREVTDYYTARFVNGTGVLRYRFTDTFSMQGGIEAERGQSSDTISNVDYTLVGLPLSVTYNSTDNLLDPTRGVRLTASLAPYPKFLRIRPRRLRCEGPGQHLLRPRRGRTHRHRRRASRSARSAARTLTRFPRTAASMRAAAAPCAATSISRCRRGASSASRSAAAASSKLRSRPASR